ncbi:MAG: hypothetical protein GC165_00570 [Armatimonadetes bacterium]|nr:hypothetical protein [Armatimonadota bacterium]
MQSREAFASLLDGMDKPYDLRDSVRIDHWRAVWAGSVLMGDTSKGTFRDLGYTDEDRLPGVLMAGRRLPLFGKAQLSQVHEYFANVEKGLPRDPSDFEQAKKVLSKSTIWTSRLDLSKSLLRNFPGLTDFAWIDDFVAEMARRNVIRQALALMDFGVRAKALPLGGRATLDTDGKPLRLSHQKNGWVVYSVGQNGVDQLNFSGPMVKDDFIIPESPEVLDPKEWKERTVVRP